MSRYGIAASKEDVRKLIMHDLAGGNSVDESLDIPEIVAILLIPYLRKASSLDPTQDQMNRRSTAVSRFEKEALEKKELLRSTHTFDSKIIDNVLNLILTETTGSSDTPPLTKELLRKIFEEYEEPEIANDDELLQEMVSIAKGDTDGAFLDTASFKRALTSDLGSYNESLEHKFTTHYEDVFGLVSVEKLQDSQDDDELESTPRPRGAAMDARNEDSFRSESIKRIFVFPQIDYLADSFRDKTQYVMVWLAVIFGYISYFNPFDSYGIQVCSDENMEKFSCKVGQSIAVWCAILVIML